MAKLVLNITLNCPFQKPYENHVDGSGGGARLLLPRRSA